jgi:tetratricopeptide (TPR) repeat protein
MDDSIRQKLHIARERYDKREFERARPHLEALVAQGVKFADVHNMLGVILHDQGEFSEARAHFEAAVKINPGYTEALINLSVTLNELGQFQDAQKLHDQLRAGGVGAVGRTAQEIEPFARGKLANLHAEVADAYSDLGLYREAAQELQKALSLCPTFADLQTRLGKVLRDSGELAAAQRAFEAAVAANPKFVTARIQLGVVKFSIGDRKGAESEWEEVLNIAPDDRFAAMYLRMSRANRMRTSHLEIEAIQPPKDAEGDPLAEVKKN